MSGAQEHHLPLLVRDTGVLGSRVHVALRQVEELVLTGLQDGVALLHRRAALDAERLDERLLHVLVGPHLAAGVHRDVGRVAVGAEDLHLERLGRGGDLEVAEVGHVEHARLCARELVAPVKLVHGERLQRRVAAAREEAEVDVSQFDPEVPQLGWEVQRSVVEGRAAADAAVGVEQRCAQVLAHAELAPMHHARALGVGGEAGKGVGVPERVLELERGKVHGAEGAIVFSLYRIEVGTHRVIMHDGR